MRPCCVLAVLAAMCDACGALLGTMTAAASRLGTRDRARLLPCDKHWAGIDGWLENCRDRSALLMVRVSSMATPGHVLLAEPQWRYLGLQPRSHAKLTRVMDESELRPRPLSEMQSLKLSVVGGATAL